jgi:hypothetical protein
VKQTGHELFDMATGLLALIWLTVAPSAVHTQANSQAAEMAKFTEEKSLGSPAAPIKVEVFDDYECPACGEFYEQTLKPMISDYVDSGEVYLIHRDFPNPEHLYSRQAARWVNAAARIGKFEAVERSLFDNQDAWSEFGTGNRKGNIQPFVEKALSRAEFKQVVRLMQGCESNSHQELKGCVVDAAIQHDFEMARSIPLISTPTCIISCRGQTYPPIASVVAWPILKQFLDQLLKQQ